MQGSRSGALRCLVRCGSAAAQVPPAEPKLRALARSPAPTCASAPPAPGPPSQALHGRIPARTEESPPQGMCSWRPMVWSCLSSVARAVLGTDGAGAAEQGCRALRV